MQILIQILLFLISLTVTYENQSTEQKVQQIWFENKPELLQQVLANDFKLGDYNKEAALQIIPQIISQYPKLKLLERVKTEEDGVISLNYKFDDGSIETSNVKTDANGQILSIELFDNVLLQHPVSKEKAEENNLNEVSFLDLSERKKLYELLISEIEKYDAEAIETRNNTKKAKWTKYKKHKKKSFIQSKDWQQLADGFNSFADGFVNLHSKFSFNSSIKKKPLKSTIKIAYSYPEIGFFVDDENTESIDSINGESIKKLFNSYENYNCSFNSTIGCLDSFSRAFESGLIKIKGNLPTSLQASKNEYKLEFLESKPTDPMQKYLEPVDISPYQDWTLISKGYKTAVFKKDHHLLIRIKDFIFTAGTGGDLRCSEPAAENTLCYDVQVIRAVLNDVATENTNLIIDVQNNGGGNENSPFLAELSLNEFEDLRVQYRNSDLLDDKNLRNNLFYGSPKAESWYKNIIGDRSQHKAEFLPPRADFCQANDQCLIQSIKPNKQRRFKQLNILTNQNCVSSCDDFVWRMQEYSNAKIVGLPNAADATYSRISILFYLDENREIKTSYFGDGGNPEYQGTKLFEITIPYSKTVNKKGQLRQGQPAKLDLVVPVTKKNYKKHNLDVLKQALTL